jgi:hypothetical protein
MIHGHVIRYFDLAKICGARDMCHYFNRVTWISIKKKIEQKSK